MTNRMEIDKLLEKYQISPRELHERTIEDSIGWWRMIVPVAFTKKVIDENEFVAWWGIGEDKKTNLERRLKILIERDSYMSAHLEDDEIPDEMKEVILDQQRRIIALGSELEALDEKWKI